MKKIRNFSIILFVLVMLVGCGNGKDELTKVKSENEKLQNEIKELKDLQNSPTIKDTIEMKVLILNKSTSKDYDFKKDAPNSFYIIATDDDLDHNTPLMISVKPEDYEKLEVGTEYTLEVYVISLYDRDEAHFRNEITLLSIK